MNKQPSFQDTWDKTMKFYDFQYHLHKSTFKGLSAWIKQYSQIEKLYAQKLLELTNNIKTQVPQYEQQMPAIRQMLNSTSQSLSTMSQLHSNFSQRLNELSAALLSQYLSSKKLKQKHMKLFKQIYQDKIISAKQTKNRANISASQLQLTKKLFRHLESYSQEQLSRQQKVKQQLLIFWTLSKKITEKQLETTSKWKSKIAQQEIQLKVTSLDQINQKIVDFYNANMSQQQGKQKLQRMDFQKVIKKNDILRESLKQSTLLRQKINKINEFKNRISSAFDKYQKIPQNLPQHVFIVQQSQIVGLFDKNILKNSYKYQNLIKQSYMKRISLGMLNSFIGEKGKSDKNDRVIVLRMKAKLEVRGQLRPQTWKGLGSYMMGLLKEGQKVVGDMQIRDKENKQMKLHIGFLVILNQIYSRSQQENNTNRLSELKDKERKQGGQNESASQKILVKYLKIVDTSLLNPLISNLSHFHPNISHVLIKTLLQTIISVEQDQPLLIDQFIDHVSIVQTFAFQVLSVPVKLTRLIALQLFQKAMSVTKTKYIEEIHLLLQGLNKNQKNMNKKHHKDSPSKYIDSSHYKQTQKLIIANILTSITSAIIQFYSLGIPLINYFCVLICIENLSSGQFSAVEYFHKCIKRSGLNYVLWIDEEKSLLESDVWVGQMRLRNLVGVLEKLQYVKMQESHFYPTGKGMSDILGVDEKIIVEKLRQEMLEPLGDMVEENLNLLLQEGGIDKQGYILKLGILLSQLSLPTHRSPSFTDKYFTLLNTYLSNTQIQYNNLLDHSRKTQLWISQENTIATQNCIDFCSLLYKPFQFLLKTIKLLLKQNKTQFTLQFDTLIKNRMNNILKQQILNYLQFLLTSLNQYQSNGKQIHYKPTKSSTLLPINSEFINISKTTFSEILKRMYNLSFLKDELKEILNDFLDQSVLEDLQHDIFNLSKLSLVVNKYKQQREILINLKDIIESISKKEEQLIQKVADITVWHCLKPIFNNLYFQQEKSAFEEFFSTKTDYALSPFTFVYYQSQLQDFFTMLSKNLPSDYQPQFYPKMLNAFFYALKQQLFNISKFKIPKNKDQIIKYIDQDSSFLSTMIKLKYLPQSTVHQYLQKPLQKLLQIIKLQTKELIIRFEAETLQNNSQHCRAIMVLLYMRVNDQKAQEFFKKFKNIVFK